MGNPDKKTRKRIRKLEIEIELLEKADRFFTTTVPGGADKKERIKACQEEIKRLQKDCGE